MCSLKKPAAVSPQSLSGMDFSRGFMLPGNFQEVCIAFKANSGMVFSRGLMTPGKFQEVTEALMAWIFPGGLEISRGPWKFPGGYRNLGVMVFSRGHGNFQGVLEKSREPPYFTLVTG